MDTENMVRVEMLLTFAATAALAGVGAVAAAILIRGSARTGVKLAGVMARRAPIGAVGVALALSGGPAAGGVPARIKPDPSIEAPWFEPGRLPPPRLPGRTAHPALHPRPQSQAPELRLFPRVRSERTDGPKAQFEARSRGRAIMRSQVRSRTEARARAEAMARHPAGKGSTRVVPGQDHVVRPGDSLWLIARDALHTSDLAAIASYWPRIYAANRNTIGEDPDLLLPGQRLRLPKP